MTDTSAATKSLVVERAMPHPPTKVWRALTQAALIGEWLMRNDFEPVVGRRFNFSATPIPGMWNGVTDCEVLVVEPPPMAWYPPSSWGRKPDCSMRTWVPPSAAGVRVQVTTVFRPAAASSPEAFQL